MYMIIGNKPSQSLTTAICAVALKKVITRANTCNKQQLNELVYMCEVVYTDEEQMWLTPLMHVGYFKFFLISVQTLLFFCFLSSAPPISFNHLSYFSSHSVEQLHVI